MAPPWKRSNWTSIPASQLFPPPPATKVGLSASQSAKAFTRGPKDDFAIETLCCWAVSSERITFQVGTHLHRFLLRLFEGCDRENFFRERPPLVSESFSAGMPIAEFNCALAMARLFCALISSCFARRHPYLGAQVVGFNGHAAIEAILAPVQDAPAPSSTLDRRVPVVFSPAARRSRNPPRGKQLPVRCVRVDARMRP